MGLCSFWEKKTPSHRRFCLHGLNDCAKACLRKQAPALVQEIAARAGALAESCRILFPKD